MMKSCPLIITPSPRYLISTMRYQNNRTKGMKTSTTCAFTLLAKQQIIFGVHLSMSGDELTGTIACEDICRAIVVASGCRHSCIILFTAAHSARRPH